MLLFTNKQKNMKKSERKELEKKLLIGAKKLLKANKVILTNKTEKAIIKVFKQVAKKACKKKIIPSKK